nr:AAA family ATPase [Chlamydiota bacterium]
MRLKKLKIVGFKSFADKVSIDFDREIIGIVGPNGCGKSNIVDAFRWVLGEQSAKSMRAGGMQDVLFAGTTKRAALNFAEVSITLSDVGETLKTPYEEVTITRRLYRNGDSEYLLNRETVRLRDIHHLLLGSGVGKNAFSIFEQGRIDRVIHLSPLSRRSIFDEAAGIGLFLEKKKETLRKLSAAEENFNRIQDVYGEVAKQAATLKRQASMAKSFQENKARLEHLEQAVLATKLRQLLSQGSEQKQQYMTLQEEYRQISVEVETLVAEAAKAKELLQIEEKDAHGKRERLFESEKSFEVQSVEIKRAKERKGELEVQLHSLHEEKRSFKDLALIEKDDELEQKLSLLEKSVRDLRDEREELERLQLEAAKAHEARFLTEEVQKQKSKVVELDRDIENRKSGGTKLREESAALKAKWQEVSSAFKEKKREIDQLHRQIAELAVRTRSGNQKLQKAFPQLKSLLESVKPKKGCEAVLHSYSDTLIVHPNELDEVLAFAKKQGLENYSLLPSASKKLAEHFAAPLLGAPGDFGVTKEGIYTDHFGVLFQTPKASRVKIKQQKEEAESALKRCEASLIDPASFEEKWRKKEMDSVQENFFLQELLGKKSHESRTLQQLEKKLSKLGQAVHVETKEERLEEVKELLPKLREQLQEVRTKWHQSEQARAASNAKKQAQEERAVKIEREVAECEKHRILCEKVIQSRSGGIEGQEEELKMLRLQFEKQSESLERARKKLTTLDERLGKRRGRLNSLSEKIHKLEVASASQSAAQQELEKALENISWEEIE